MNPFAYKKRRVQSFESIDVNGRTLKMYGVFSARNEDAVFPRMEVMRNVLARLVSPERNPDDHPVGFAILHFADDGTYLLLSHWFDANMLKHQVFQCQVSDHEIAITADLTNTKIIACIWEIDIIKFERDAWIRTVLQTGRLDKETAAAYLATSFFGWV